MSLWDKTKAVFVAQAKQLTWEWIPDQSGTPPRPDETYFAVWLRHGFLARSRSWLKKLYPATHVSVRMNVAGTTTTLTKLARPAEDKVGPGVWVNFPVTGLTPYRGGTVEVEAGLTALERSSMLGAAVSMLGDFSSLVGPPLSQALEVADKVGEGVQTMLDADEGEVVLGLHQAYGSPGAGPSPIGPGHLAVVNAPQGSLQGALEIKGDRLHLRTRSGSKPLQGHDYLLLAIECKEERDDWRFAHLEKLIQAAITAHFAGETAAFERHRNDVLAEILNSPDLTRPDRNRVAHAVKDELQAATEVGQGIDALALPSLEAIVDARAVGLAHPLAMQDVSLNELIT